MKSIIPFLLYVSLRVSSVEAVASATFLPSTFTAWFWQSLIVVDKWLYIGGGEMHSEQDGDVIFPPSPQTFAIDLSNSWTTSTVTAKVSDRDETFKVSRRPELFYDPSHNMVYSQGGQSYGAKNETFAWGDDLPEVWGFTPSTDGSVDWKMQYSKNLSANFPLTSNVGFALATSSGNKHYSLGGFISFLYDEDEGTNQDMVMEEFVTYDYETQTFDNQTRATPHSLQGEAQFAPQYGEEGVLLFFGGKNPTDRGVAGFDISDLGSIQVYDIHTGNFYTQGATNPPQGRYNFCSVGASNAQNSSYEIFIYGGSTGASSPSSAAAMSKVYILTLPSFSWIEAPVAADTWRVGHACHPIGAPARPTHNQRQMLSVGGMQDPMPDGSSFDTYRETWTSGMKIFDLTALTWGDSYNASAAAYERPAIVDSFYAGNSPYPAKWGDMALKAIFNNSAAVSPTATAERPLATSISPPEDGPSKSAAMTRGVVGGVVGGVGGTAVLALLLWWFWWRKRAPRAAAAELDAEGYHSPPAQGPWNKDHVGLNELNDTSRVELMTQGYAPARKEEPVMEAQELQARKEEPVMEAQELPAGENGARYG